MQGDNVNITARALANNISRKIDQGNDKAFGLFLWSDILRDSERCVSRFERDPSGNAYIMVTPHGTHFAGDSKELNNLISTGVPAFVTLRIARGKYIFVVSVFSRDDSA